MRFKRLFQMGAIVGVFVLGFSIGQTMRSTADAASQATRIGRAQTSVYQFRLALRNAEAEFAAIIDEGGLVWLNAADPALPAGTADDAVAARAAIVALRATLDANSKQHEKALVRFEP